MMNCIVSMAEKLGCETVAEGVENPRQASRAASCGIHTLQGFMFSASLPPDELVTWVENHEKSLSCETESQQVEEVAA